MPLLLILAVAAFVSAASIRLIDPLIPAIARETGVGIETAALLATAYTLPYAFSQPVLGPIGDTLGKIRVMRVCLGMLALSLVLGAFANSYEWLVVARIAAGIGGGGVIPLAFGIIGDRFPASERQVALSKLVMASQIAILGGSALGGVVAEHVSWRVMFVVPGVLGFAALALLASRLPGETVAERRPISIEGAKDGYAAVFKSPLAPLALIGVFVEGLAMFGLTPFIAHRLEERGLGTLSEAGIVLGSMSIGAIVFTLAVRRLLDALGRIRLIEIGGVISFVALTLVAFSVTWWMEAIAFGLLGIGFFMIHNCLQAVGVDLAPGARASGIAMFAFMFFAGQAMGPIIYRVAFAHLGPAVPLLLGGLALLIVAFWVAHRLRRIG